jgi:CPA1 family monovalent cation:H+ antiporter
MHALEIDALTSEEEVGYYKSKAQMYEEALRKIDDLFDKRQLTQQQFNLLRRHYRTLHQTAWSKCRETIGDSGELVENLLRIYALGLEKGELKEIFQRGEINEKTYKKIFNMLSIQTERIERGQRQVHSAGEHFPIDGMERFVLLFSRLAFWRDHVFNPEELYHYYRTLNRLTSLVIEELIALGHSEQSAVFDDLTALEKILKLYRDIQANTERRMASLLKKNAIILNRLNRDAAEVSLHALQMEVLSKLNKNEIITDKLFIILKRELEEKSRAG